MRVLFNVLGVLCLPVGVVWVLQGFNILRSSVMSGHSRWIFIGALVFIVGAVILFFNNRKRARA